MIGLQPDATSMRRRLVKDKPTHTERLPEVVPPTPAVDERPISPSSPGASARLRQPTSLPSPLFSSAALAGSADNKRLAGAGSARDRRKSDSTDATALPA